MGLVAALLVPLLAACAPSRTPSPKPTTGLSPRPAAVASPTQEPDLFAGALPLPPGLGLPDTGVEVAPASPRGLVVGQPIAFDLGHCGLASPVDLDGSLWEPVGAVDARGGPIDTDEEVGTLINGSPGEVVLVAHERLDWRARTSGEVVVFRRLPGARVYPLCM